MPLLSLELRFEASIQLLLHLLGHNLKKLIPLLFIFRKALLGLLEPEEASVFNIVEMGQGSSHLPPGFSPFEDRDTLILNRLALTHTEIDEVIVSRD